jgi:hypothetical protein
MKQITLCFCLLVAFISPRSSASALTFDLNTPFTAQGVGSPLETAWLSASFTDVAGGVQLSLSADGLPTGSYVTQWYFSIFQNTEIAPPLQQGSTTDPRLQLFLLSPDNLNAGTAGTTIGNGFDISMTFSTAGDLFESLDTASFLFSDPPGIISDWFNQLNTAGVFYAAANVLDLNGGGSWIAATSATTPGPGPDPDPGPKPVPEPATIMLLGFGLSGLIAFSRKKFFA